MYVVSDWVKENVENMSFGDRWSSPRKEENRNSPTGENVVPREKTIRVNPNGVKQGGIPKKESLMIANPKGNPSGRQTKLFPRCQRENSNEDPSWRQKELIPRDQQKWRGIPEKEPLGVFTPKYDPSWRQKEINYEVPEGYFIRSVKFLRRSQMVQKGNHSEAPAWEFCTSRTIST